MAIRDNNHQSIDENNLLNLTLSYNPYTYETFFENIEFDKSSVLRNFLFEKKDKQFQFWYRDLLPIVEKEYNTKNFAITFKGRIEEFLDLKEEIEFLNTDGWIIDFNHEQEKEKEEKTNIFNDLKKLVEDIKENAPVELLQELNDKKAFDQFETAENSEAYVSVIATMSSGKSTLINAILEAELLPAKNEACTATICHIKDIDGMENFKARVEDLEGNEIHSWQAASSDFLTEVNEAGNQKGLNIFLEGDIPSISSEEMNLVMIDTPGPNNSQNMEHREATYRYIKDNQNNPLVLYVMNSTQHATNDDNNLLTEIADIIKQKGKQAEERFLFAINKIDNFDPEKESIENLIKNNKAYLQEKGIENPRIFPVSAEFAKLKKLQLKGEKITRTEKGRLSNYEGIFIPEPEEEYLGIDTIKYASIPETLKNELYKESEENIEKSYLHYSGITAIEKYIDKYVSKYAKTQKINDAIKTLKLILDSEYGKIKSMQGKTEKELEELKNQLDTIQDKINTQGKEKIEEIENKIKNINIDESKFDNLLSKIADVFSELSWEFEDESASENKARETVKEAKRELENLMIQLQTSMESILKDQVKEKAESILLELKKYFSNVLQEINIDKNLSSTLSNVFELQMPGINTLVNKGTYTKEVYAGQEYVRTERHGFLWLKKRDIYKDVYRNEERVDMRKIFDEEISPLQKEFRTPIDKGRTTLRDNIQVLKEQGLSQIQIVEKSINDRLKELKDKTVRAGKLEQQSEELQKEINKIIDYKNKLDEIISL